MAWTEQPRRCNNPMRRTTPSSCRSCARGTTAPAPIRTSRHRRAPSSSSAAPTAAVRLLAAQRSRRRYSENREASQGDCLVWDTVPHGISYVGLCRIGSCRVVYHADKDTGIHALCDIVSYGIPACAVGCIITVCKYRRPAPSERMQPCSALRQCSWRGSG